MLIQILKVFKKKCEDNSFVKEMQLFNLLPNEYKKLGNF